MKHLMPDRGALHKQHRIQARSSYRRNSQVAELRSHSEGLLELNLLYKKLCLPSRIDQVLEKK